MKEAICFREFNTPPSYKMGASSIRNPMSGGTEVL